MDFPTPSVNDVEITTVLSPTELKDDLRLEGSCLPMATYIMLMNDGTTIRAKLFITNSFFYYSYDATWNRNPRFGVVYDTTNLRSRMREFNKDTMRRLIARAFREAGEDPTAMAVRNETFKSMAKLKLTATETDLRIWLSDQPCYNYLVKHPEVAEYLHRISFPNVRKFYCGEDHVWRMPVDDLQNLEDQLQTDPERMLFKIKYEKDFPLARELALDERLDAIAWKHAENGDKLVALLNTYRLIVKHCADRLALFCDFRMFNWNHVADLITLKALVVSPFWSNRIYPHFHWAAQEAIAECTRILLKRPSFMPSEVYGADVQYFPRDHLDPGQLDALSMIECKPLTVLTGGPGTGKTEVSKHLQRRGHNVLYLATTGAAAMVLSHRLGVETFTVHFALQNFTDKEWNSYTDVFVDESTMMPISIAVSLLRRLCTMPKLCHTCFSGDPNQLQGMEAGAFFKSLIISRVVPVATLTVIFRLITDDADMIRRNAQRVLDGDTDFETGPAFEHHGSLTKAEICEILDTYKENVTFMSYHRKTVKMYNNMLMEHNKIKVGQLKVGQSIVFRKNHYRAIPGKFQKQERKTKQQREQEEEEGEGETKKKTEGPKPMIQRCISNGMTGVIEEIVDVCKQNPRQRAKVEHNGVPVLPGFARYITLNNKHTKLTINISAVQMDTICNGNVRTLHESQGSENDVVVMFITDRGFDSSLAYMGMTRAKRKVIMVGSDEALLRMMRNRPPNKESELGALIRKYMEPKFK